MLIKNYTRDGKTFIIEQATNVVIACSVYDYNDRSLVEELPDGPNMWGDNSHYDNELLQETDPRIYGSTEQKRRLNDCRLVYYTDKSGVRNRLVVFNVAYVCNDDGKTIEVVKVSA